MGFFSDVFTKKNTMEVIDVQSTFNLWNVLVSRYQSVENLQMFKGLVHDKELIVIINSLLDYFAKQIESIEKEAEKFKIKLPGRPPSEIKVTAQVNEVTDRFIYNRILETLVNQILSLARAVRTTLTNDRIRGIFHEFLTKHFQQYGVLHKYGKLKGWDNVNPSFKTNNPQESEALSVSEAFNLWHHISMRYQQLELTMFFQSYTHDPDFKIGMLKAVDTLKEQIGMLEKIALNYKVPLPERPPASLISNVDPEAIEDRFMYQQILLGVDGMLDKHYGAILETLKNDKIREVIMQLLKHEIDIHDSMIKYGKLKGWLNLPPIYNQNLV